MARLRSGNAPTPARPAAAGGRTILREKTNTAATPGPAVETSMLALKNFKRRPRQGSMLEMVRKRRSSVQASLINAQPQQDDDVEDTSVFDLGSASEGEDDFAPEAEGTPLQLSKAQKPTSTRKSVSAKKSEATTPAVKRTKRKSDDLESPQSALDALRRKHRKSEAPPAEDESLPSVHDEHQLEAQDASEREASPVPNPVTSDVQVINSSPESTPPTEPSSTHKVPGTQEADFAVPSTEEQERSHRPEQKTLEGEEEEDEDEENDAANATMAEPASSSPIASPIPETQRTDIYADPLTQLSPPPPEPAKTRSKGNKKPTSLSTATLRALLPRRTQRLQQPRNKRTEYDISSDEEEDEATAFDTTHLDEDEDELGGRIRRNTRAPAPSKTKKTSTLSKAKSKQSQATRKPSAPPQPAKGKGKGKPQGKSTRTYGRANATSDKENEGGNESSSEADEAETSLSMREVAHSKELEEARRKFAEVDNWDLAFESMSNEDHRSSSQGWR